MIAPAMIFVVGWLAVLTFGVAAVTLATKSLWSNATPEHERLVTARRPTNHYESSRSSKVRLSS